MNGLEKSIAHMAWSNIKIFEELVKLPESIYSLAANKGEWNIGRLIYHFVEASEWYSYCLTQIPWGEPIEVSNHSKLNQSLDRLHKSDLILIEQSKLSDGWVSYKDEHGEANSERSTILAQAVTHTAEHKGQISTILKVHGYDLNLDLFDVWGFTNQ